MNYDNITYTSVFEKNIVICTEKDIQYIAYYKFEELLNSLTLDQQILLFEKATLSAKNIIKEHLKFNEQFRAYIKLEQI